MSAAICHWLATPSFAEDSQKSGKLVLSISGPHGSVIFEFPFKDRDGEDFDEANEGAFLVSAFLGAAGFYSQSLEAVRDPSFAINLEFTNQTTQPYSLIQTIDIPINPLKENSIFGELMVELRDTNGDGQASLLGNFGDGGAIQGVSLLDLETFEGQFLGPPLGADLMSPGTRTFSLNAISGPTTTNETQLSASTNFILSPGDTAHITSRFIIDEGTGIPFAEIQPLPDPDDGPFYNVYNSPPVRFGDNELLGPQSQLNVFEGGSIGSRFQVGEFNNLDNFDSELNVFGGTVGHTLTIGPGGVANVYGGSVYSLTAFRAGATANISGGLISFDMYIGGMEGGGVANISGGEYEGKGRAQTIFVSDEGILNVSGGRFLMDEFGLVTLENNATVNLYGNEFMLDGSEIDGLEPGQPFTIDARDVKLTGTLLDGATFSIDLRSTNLQTKGVDFVSPEATVTVMVPHQGDFNFDGLFTVEDIDALVTVIADQTGTALFDLSGDGTVDSNDVTAWLSTAAEQNGFSAAYLSGDANLDGSVNAADLNNLALNWRQNAALWSAGDFTADGTVNAADLNKLALNWQQSVPLAASVPEPASRCCILAITAFLMLGLRRCGK